MENADGTELAIVDVTAPAAPQIVQRAPITQIPMAELHDATGDWQPRLPELVAYWTQPAVVAVLKSHEAYLLINIGSRSDHFEYPFPDSVNTAIYRKYAQKTANTPGLLGLQYSFVSYEQIENGELTSGGYKDLSKAPFPVAIEQFLDLACSFLSEPRRWGPERDGAEDLHGQLLRQLVNPGKAR